MIVNFGDKFTEEFFHGEATTRTRKFPPDLHYIAIRKLDLINAAVLLQDLKVPPGNRLEALKGDKIGFFSIRINNQFRIIFRFKEGQASDVKIMDYH